MNPDRDDTPTGPTGPCTEEGKKRIRFNAVTHGLTGQAVVFNSEEAERYDQHNERIAVHYQPEGPIEDALVRQVADDIWRLGRASSVEHGIFALSLYNQGTENNLQVALAPARTWRDESKELTLLTLYVRRIENRLAANKAELKTLQAERSEATKESRGEAATSPQPPTPDPQPLVRVPDAPSLQPPAPSAQTPAPPPELVFSPAPSKPAPVPIAPKIDVPGPDISHQRDAA